MYVQAVGAGAGPPRIHAPRGPRPGGGLKAKIYR